MITRNKSFDNNGPLLYLVATPIGNLSEMSKRAIDTLSDMDIIAAEDTRNTRDLLAHFGIKKEYFSLREHNENEASEYLVKVMKEGKKVAYVSDAGYPGISDPGYLLVCNCIKNDIKVSTICGSCAFINALVASGLPTDHFYFHGFLSSKDSEAKAELETLKNKKETLIFYESPHRILRTINNIHSVFGDDRKAVIARELTKLNEEYIRGTLKELDRDDYDNLKGEMVVIVEGNTLSLEMTPEEIQSKVGYFVEKGLTTKSSIEVVSELYGVNKNLVKNTILKNNK